MKRNEFIHTLFRLALLGLMVLLVAFFASGKKISLNEDCNEGSRCKSCGKLNKCSLPEADKYRRNG